MTVTSMSSMTSILVRPSGASETKARSGFVTSSSYMKWKQSRASSCRTWQTWHRDGGASAGKLVAKAGLGRYSGAIHGSRIKKVWRRTPSQITQDEHDEKELVRHKQVFTIYIILWGNAQLQIRRLTAFTS